MLAIPRGATVHGVVTEVKKAGDLTGSPELALKLTSLDLGGQSYPLDTDQFKVKGPGKGEQTADNIDWRRDDGHDYRLHRRPRRRLRDRRRGRRGRGHGGFSGFSRTGRLDSRRGAGGLPPERSADGQRRSARKRQPGWRRGFIPAVRPSTGAAITPMASPYVGYPYGYPPVYYRPYYVVGGYYYWR